MDAILEDKEAKVRKHTSTSAIKALLSRHC